MNTIFKKDGKPFFVLGGQSHNTTTYSDSELSIFWNALDVMGGNVAEIPIYWEAIEPTENNFDFSTMDNLIRGAREHDKNLILLWFGTWKNGGMRYVPSWIKQNTKRFPRVINHEGLKLFVLSSHCAENLSADKKAFIAVMKHLREVDETEHTVIAVQIENEPGIGGRSYRDFGSEAELEYQSDVPKDFIDYIAKKGCGSIYEQWLNCGSIIKGNWEQVFGKKRGSEYLTAKSVAQYVDTIAAQGREIYDIPLYVNVALDMQHYGWDLPGTNYTGGGPATKLYDLWKYYTPNIDLLAPDIYLKSTKNYEKVCSIYSHDDNPLFIPESGNGLDGTNFKNMFYTIGDYSAIGFASFGIEDFITPDGEVKPQTREIVESFKCLSGALPLLARYGGTGKIHTIVQEEGDEGLLLKFGRCLIHVVFEQTRGNFLYRNLERGIERGRGLIIESDNENEFFILGVGFTCNFAEKNDVFYSEDIVSNHVAFLSVEEGHYDASETWKRDRIRTGDECDYGIWTCAQCGVVRVVLCE